MDERIAVGGCYPPTWPRPPKSPVPEQEPTSLDEQVDWMTYSHPHMYDMVHSGLDLTGAMAVSAKWARLGDELSDMGDQLARLLAATIQAWQGDSAELAKESVGSLSEWSRDSGSRATEVSGCITIQVDNANTARNSMPKPPYPLEPPHRPEPGDMVPMDRAFATGDLGVAGALVADPERYAARERSLHQQAATTMQNFQDSTRDVYSTVPRFAPPSLRRPYGPGEPPNPQPPKPQPQPQPPTQTVPSGPVGGGGGGGGPVSTGGGPRGGAVTRSPVSLGAGAGTGAAEPTPSGRPAAAAESAPTGTSGGGGGGMGGVPMGGAGMQGGGDKDRKKKKYLDGEEDIFGLEDDQVMPPVIGEVNRRA